MRKYKKSDLSLRKSTVDGTQSTIFSSLDIILKAEFQFSIGFAAANEIRNPKYPPSSQTFFHQNTA